MRNRVFQNNKGVRESAVQKNLKDSADLNKIIAHHMRAGGPGRMGVPLGDPNATRQPRYMDVPSQSYHEMMNQVTDMRSDFMQLPARIRRKFNHDLYQLLRFLEVPANRQEALELGLVAPTEEEYEQLLEESRKRRARLWEKEVQMDLEEEAEKAGDEASRPDPEANPRPPRKGAKK